ncbi:MAG: efflux RND transporter periplasmic adaptor subunit [Rhodospirillaceae bacterium]|jgi:multidrug efflux system membrane fusion protein
MKRSYLIAGSIAALAFLWVASGLLSSVPKDTVVKTASVNNPLPQVRVKRLLAQNKVGQVVLFGRTEADRKVDVRVETKGRIEKLIKQKGNRVVAGDVIAQLAVDDRAARLREAQSSVEHYKLAYEAARKLSRKAFRSRVQLAETKAKLDQAKAELASKRLDLKRTKILAPFDGVLDDLKIEVGDYVDVNSVVGTVADLDPVIIVGEVNERHRANVEQNAQAVVRFVNGKRLTGTIQYLAKVGVTKTRTFRIEIAVPNPDGELAEGLTAELFIPTESVRAHLMSPAVLTLSKEGALGVKTVQADDTVAFHPVTLVADTADGVWVAGLPEEINLITVGQEYVRAGQRVRSIYENSLAPVETSQPVAGVKP